MNNRVGSLVISVFLITLALIIATTKPVHAYIDMASASYIVQILVATLVASLFAIKLFWQRLIDRVVKFFPRKDRSEPEVK